MLSRNAREQSLDVDIGGVDIGGVDILVAVLWRRPYDMDLRILDAII
jgi:hypothetical protein